MDSESAKNPMGTKVSRKEAYQRIYEEAKAAARNAVLANAHLENPNAFVCFIESRNRQERIKLAPGQRQLGWFILPDFQRPPVWTEAQRIRFIESCWLGLPIGVFTWNDAPGTRFDQWLLDGQQRVGAVLAYMADEFPVMGYRFSELGEIDIRRWDMTVSFPCRITNLTDEAALRDVYDRLAYGGTPHEPKPEGGVPR